MSVVSPERGEGSQWVPPEKPKATGDSAAIQGHIKPTEEQLPEGVDRISPRTITNIATASGTEQHVQQAAKSIRPQAKIEDLIFVRVIDTLTELGISISSDTDVPTKEDFQAYNIHETDPLKLVKIKFIKALQADTTIDAGRKMLLIEMIIKPDQVVVDLPRLAEVQIGKTTIKQEDVGAEDSFINISTQLLTYIESQNPALTKNASDSMDELLYATSQTFFLNLLQKQHEDERIHRSEWAVPGRKISNEKTSFQMEKTFVRKPETLIITHSIETPFVRTDDEPGEQRLIKKVECRYNLKTSAVTFTSTYELNGQREIIQ